MPLVTIHEAKRCECCGHTTHLPVTTVTCDSCGEDLHDRYYNQHETNRVLGANVWNTVPRKFEGWDVNKLLFCNWKCFKDWLIANKERLKSKKFNWLDLPDLPRMHAEEFIEVFLGGS